MARDRVYNDHPSEVFHSLEALLEHCASKDNTDKGRRNRLYWTRKWKAWKLKHPSEPMVHLCATCSGAEKKRDIETGRFKVSTRQEQKERLHIRNHEGD